MTGQAKKTTTMKGHCYQCGGDRSAHIRGEHRSHWTDDDGEGLWATDHYFILQCGGCEAVFFRHDFEFSEAGGPEPPKYWPSPASRKPVTWLPDLKVMDKVLHNLLTEMYAAANNDLRVLSAIGARTAFDRASERLKVPAGLTFQAKLIDLSKRGKIGADEIEVLRTLVDAGSAAAHRSWRPTANELNTMIDVVEAFIHRSFVLGKGVRRLKAAVPRRKKS